MAKLLKHLGIGAGGKKASISPVSSGTRFDCDRIRPQFTDSNKNNEAFVPAPSVSAQVNFEIEPENSLNSTASSAIHSTLASTNDLYLAVSPLGNLSLDATDDGQRGRFSSADGNNVIDDYLKPKNIYENHDMFASQNKNNGDEGNNNVSASHKHVTLFNEDCWNEVKKWLQEMSDPNKKSSPPSTSSSSATSISHPTSQTDVENARFLSDILTVLQQARSEVFKDITSKQTPRHQLVGSPKIRVGGLLTEVAMKLESEYEKARNSLTTKDYERYTRLKELLKSELEEPIYGLKMSQFGEPQQLHLNHQQHEQQFVKQQQQYLQQLQQQPNIHNNNKQRQQQNILDLSSTSTSPRGSACYDEPWNSDEVQNDIIQDHLPVSKLTAGNVLNSNNTNGVNVNDNNGNNNMSESTNSSCNNNNIDNNFNNIISNDNCGNEIDDANNNVIGSMPSSTSVSTAAAAETSQTIFTTAAATDTAAVTHNMDLRTRTGYEPPWDWKPHQKDNRKQEGYEKPWDLKPHDKDNRSSKEYEEPWDNKGLKVENELIAAKLAKDAKVTSKQDVPVSKLPPKKDYDDPWDQKSKGVEIDVITAKIAKETVRIGFSNPSINNPNNNNNVNVNNNNSSNNINNITNVNMNNVSSSNNSDVVGGCSKRVSILVQQQPTQQQHLHHQLNIAVAQSSSSPFKKPLPPLPTSSTSPSSSASPSSLSSSQQQQLAAKQLLEQIWYHGKLGRAGAESLLQRHREASFLVRRSENRPDEYSLSVRSTKGFMHLKINNDDSGRFILGQFSQPFISIQQMVQYYATNKLPIKGAEHISLLHPVSKSA